MLSANQRHCRSRRVRETPASVRYLFEVTPFLLPGQYSSQTTLADLISHTDADSETVLPVSGRHTLRTGVLELAFSSGADAYPHGDIHPDHMASAGLRVQQRLRNGSYENRSHPSVLSFPTPLDVSFSRGTLLSMEISQKQGPTPTYALS